MIVGPDRHQLEPLELASGLVLGLQPVAAHNQDRGRGESPRQALERVVLAALRRAPCLVSFSGGRDSSAVLALATAVARREGLPLPIPATNRFPAAASTDESDWQEQVVSHLGLEDWVRLEHTDELDCVGSITRDVLQRHGLLWPFNNHFHEPLLRLAAGGSLLTGIGGDELLSPSTWTRALDVLHARVRPEPRDVLRIASALAPHPLRRRVLRHRVPVSYQWLRPHAQRLFAEAWAAQRGAEPLRWGAHYEWVHRLRYIWVGEQSLRVLAQDHDARAFHPFLDPEFAVALSALPRQNRYRGRTQAMRAIFGDLLPEQVITRSSKTGFDDAFWNEPSRAFAASWNGEDVDLELVDAEGLAREWASLHPDPRSFLVLQSVWLAGEKRSADRLEQALDSRGK